MDKNYRKLQNKYDTESMELFIATIEKNARNYMVYSVANRSVTL